MGLSSNISILIKAGSFAFALAGAQAAFGSDSDGKNPLSPIPYQSIENIVESNMITHCGVGGSSVACILEVSDTPVDPFDEADRLLAAPVTGVAVSLGSFAVKQVAKWGAHKLISTQSATERKNILYNAKLISGEDISRGDVWEFNTKSRTKEILATTAVDFAIDEIVNYGQSYAFPQQHIELYILKDGETYPVYGVKMEWAAKIALEIDKHRFIDLKVPQLQNLSYRLGQEVVPERSKVSKAAGFMVEKLVKFGVRFASKYISSSIESWTFSKELKRVGNKETKHRNYAPGDGLMDRIRKERGNKFEFGKAYRDNTLAGKKFTTYLPGEDGTVDEFVEEYGDSRYFNDPGYLKRAGLSVVSNFEYIPEYAASYAADYAINKVSSKVMDGYYRLFPKYSCNKPQPQDGEKLLGLTLDQGRYRYIYVPVAESDDTCKG